MQAAAPTRPGAVSAVTACARSGNVELSADQRADGQDEVESARTRNGLPDLRRVIDGVSSEGSPEYMCRARRAASQPERASTKLQRPACNTSGDRGASEAAHHHLNSPHLQARMTSNARPA